MCCSVAVVHPLSTQGVGALPSASVRAPPPACRYSLDKCTSWAPSSLRAPTPCPATLSWQRSATDGLMPSPHHLRPIATQAVGRWTPRKEVGDSAATEALSQDFKISWLEYRQPLQTEHWPEPVLVCILRFWSEELIPPLPLAVMLVGDGHFWEPNAMNNNLNLLVGNPAAKCYYWALPLPTQEKVQGDSILGSRHGYDYRAVKRFAGSLLCHSKWDQAGIADVRLDPSRVSLWGISTRGSGILYQAVIPIRAKLPLDHFWRSSHPSPIAVASMWSTTIIAPFINSDRVYREFRDLEELWLDWHPTAANPVVHTTDGEDYGDVRYEVKHQAGVFKHASGYRTSIHVLTCPPYETVDREGRPKQEHHVVWGRCLANPDWRLFDALPDRCASDNASQFWRSQVNWD